MQLQNHNNFYIIIFLYFYISFIKNFKLIVFSHNYNNYKKNLDNDIKLYKLTTESRTYIVKEMCDYLNLNYENYKKKSW